MPVTNRIKNTAERRKLNAAMGIEEKPHYRYNWKTGKPDITIHIEAIIRANRPRIINPNSLPEVWPCH